MDLTKTIDALRRDKKKLEHMIASMKERRATADAPTKKRRGRKSISAEERRKISAKIERYWTDRRNQRRAWS
jgi:hypothetical protein